MLVAIPVLSWTMEADGEIAPAPLLADDAFIAAPSL
jgi:hypothetical protein